MGMVNRCDMTSASKILWILCLTATCGVVTLKEDIGTATIGFCPEEWMHHQTSCYIASRSSFHVDYHTAQSECKKLGADLVSLNDIDELQYVIGNSEVNTFWIGLLRTCCTSCPPDDHTTDWMWQDGTLLTTDNWDELDGEPTGNSDCGCIKNKGLGDAPCSAKHPYVCEMSVVRAIPQLPSADLCQLNWKYSSQSCYWASPPSDTLNYFKARNKCYDLAAKLLSINNEEEFRFVSNFFPTTAFWIGLWRECGTSCPPDNHTTDWMWKDGTQLDIDKWYKYDGEPTGNSPCGSFVHYKFVVASCAASKAYICEKPAAIPESTTQSMSVAEHSDSPCDARLTAIIVLVVICVVLIAVIACLLKKKLKKHLLPCCSQDAADVVEQTVRSSTSSVTEGACQPTNCALNPDSENPLLSGVDEPAREGHSVTPTESDDEYMKEGHAEMSAEHEPEIPKNKQGPVSLRSLRQGEGKEPTAK